MGWHLPGERGSAAGRADGRDQPASLPAHCHRCLQIIITGLSAAAGVQSSAANFGQRLQGAARRLPCALVGVRS